MHELDSNGQEKYEYEYEFLVAVLVPYVGTTCFINDSSVMKYTPIKVEHAGNLLIVQHFATIDFKCGKKTTGC